MPACSGPGAAGCAARGPLDERPRPPPAPVVAQPQRQGHAGRLQVRALGVQGRATPLNTQAACWLAG